MEQILQQILSELQEVKAEQQGMRREFDSFKEEQKSMRQEFNGFKEEQEAMRKEFKSGQAALREEFKGDHQSLREEMREGFTYVNKRIDRLESRMESEVIDKIRILFDAREVFNDNLIEFRREFNFKIDKITQKNAEQDIILNKLTKVINLDAVK